MRAQEAHTPQASTPRGSRQLSARASSSAKSFLPNPLLAREQERARHAPLPQHPPQNLLRALVPD
jgi:hypothetical protein